MEAISTIDGLRLYVKVTLCDKHGLEPDQFPLDESILTRRGRPCGLYFCQIGPRQMRAHAVWDGDRRVIAFYDSSGCRFRKDQLPAKLDTTRLAA